MLIWILAKKVKSKLISFLGQNCQSYLFQVSGLTMAQAYPKNWWHIFTDFFYNLPFEYILLHTAGMANFAMRSKFTPNVVHEFIRKTFSRRCLLCVNSYISSFEVDGTKSNDSSLVHYALKLTEPIWLLMLPFDCNIKRYVCVRVWWWPALSFTWSLRMQAWKRN